MYCLNPNDDEPIFCLFDPIGFDATAPTAPYVSGSDFAKELMWLDGQHKKRIVLYINCEGGQVKDGYNIAAVMLNMRTPVDGVILHTAASMGGIIAMCCRTLQIMDFGSMMLHLAYNSDGSEDKGLENTNTGIITTVSKRWGKSEEKVKEILTAETYFTSKEAFKQGLVDEIITSSDKNIPDAGAEAKEKRVYAMAFVNKLLNKEKIPNKMEKKEICELLGLDPNVSDTVAMEALKSHMAKAKVALAKMSDDDDDKKALKKAKDEAEAATAKLAKMEKEKAEEDDKKAKAEEDDKKAKAKAHAKNTIIAKAKERGFALEEKQVDAYVGFAGDTPEGLASVIDTIENIPVLKKAPVMNKLKEGEKPEYLPELPFIPQGQAVTDRPSPNGFEAGDTSEWVKAFNKMPREAMAKVKVI